MPSLWITHGGTRFPVRRGEIVIGRSAYCTIVVSDESVSREHASLRLVDDVLLLTDLGSKNGTRINGEPVVKTEAVKVGDTIHLGSATLRIEATALGGSSRRPTGDLLDAPEDPTTQSTSTMVQLMSGLIDHALETGTSAKYVGTIRGLVGSMVESVEAGFRLHENDGPKLVRAVSFVVTCSEDPAQQAWGTEVLSKLGLAP